MFGRYSHLVRAVHSRRRVLQDTILESRVTSLRAWNSVRFAVAVLLSFGLLGTAFSAAARAVPGGAADSFVNGAIAFSTTLSVLLGLLYAFLTRLLGQLEIDILAILTVDHAN